MQAMRLEKLSDLRTETQPLALRDLPIPQPGPGELLIQVSTCAVCHTELDEIEGRATPPTLPIIPGHQVVGRVVGHGSGAGAIPLGTRVGAAWIFSACGHCPSCMVGLENLCPQFRATGRDANGGYAEYMTLPEAFAHQLPDGLSDAETAPLLCAGAVGYRSLNLTGLQDHNALGLTGFGASGHLVLKMVQHLFPHARVHVFARSPAEQDFACQLGAAWAGDTQDTPPELLDAVIDTTPAWQPILSALKTLKSGGRLVINAIRKESGDLPALLNLDYPSHLWLEKEIKSVANVTRQDVQSFLRLAAAIPIHPEIQEYQLEDANLALIELKQRKIRGAKVLRIEGGSG
jgi:propanol-preferring alcohol dehydrogenase